MRELQPGREVRPRRPNGGAAGRRFQRLRFLSRSDDLKVEYAAKYLLILDVNSTHYGPRTRSMREDPLLDADPHEKFYGEAAVARSKYDEDVYINNHTTVWGIGATGIKAAETASDLMKANIACKEAAVGAMEEGPPPNCKLLKHQRGIIPSS